MTDTNTPKPWYIATTKETCAAFGVQIKKGLSTEQVRAQKREAKKSKAVPVFSMPGFPVLFWCLQLVSVALVVSVYELDKTPWVFIFMLAAVIFTLFAIAQQNYVKHGLLVIAKPQPPLITVRRDGLKQAISVNDIVPGDIVILAQGDFTPVDIRLIEVKNLNMSQEKITGEALPAPKNTFTLHKTQKPIAQTNMALAGSYVHSGSGVGIVVGLTDSPEQQAAIPRSIFTKNQNKRRLVATAIVFGLGLTILFFGVNVYAVVGLSAILSLSAYIYTAYWLEFVVWVALYEQLLTIGLRPKSFSDLQHFIKSDEVWLNVQDQTIDVASFIYRLQAELGMEVRALLKKQQVKELEQELNISGSALTKTQFMAATRANKLKMLREYQLLVGFDEIATNEALSLLRQAEHHICWVDSEPQVAAAARIASGYVPQLYPVSPASSTVATAAYTKQATLKKLSLVFDAIKQFKSTTAY